MHENVVGLVIFKLQHHMWGKLEGKTLVSGLMIKSEPMRGYNIKQMSCMCTTHGYFSHATLHIFFMLVELPSYIVVVQILYYS